MAAGYSGTPLGKKLGVKDGQRTWRYAMPESIAAEIADCGVSPVLVKEPMAGLQMVHPFVTRRNDFAWALERVRGLIERDGIIWVSGPKKGSKVEANMNERVVRDEAFPLGLVDIKVCMVDAVWLGLKLMIRRSERGTR